MIDFILAALPWVLAGIGAAIAIVKFNDQKKKQQSVNDNALAMGAIVGMISGGAIGLLVKPIGMGIGVSLGMLWGLVVGMYIKPSEKKAEPKKAAKHKKKR